MDKYILVGDKPVAEPSSLKWGEWMGTANRRIGYTTFNGGDIRVSTVFLGLDHSFAPGTPPILFETMVFSGNDAEGHHSFEEKFMDRYFTYKEAVTGHEEVVDILRQKFGEEDEPQESSS